MKRSDLQRLADLRVDEATSLLRSGYPDGAYYLAGYAIEAAIKAIVAIQFEHHTVPDRRLVEDFHKHDFKTLLRLARIDRELENSCKKDQDFNSNWSIIEGWSINARYSVNRQIRLPEPEDVPGGLSLRLLDEKIEASEAHALINAIADENKGVLPWLKRFW